jgi:hypothetical protein
LGASFTGFNIKENLQRANSHQSQGENLLTKKVSFNRLYLVDDSSFFVSTSLLNHYIQSQAFLINQLISIAINVVIFFE